MNQLNAYLALETIHNNIERAERHRRAHPAPEQPPAGSTPDAGARRTDPQRSFAAPRLRRVLAALRH